jgi:hypothetical protein
VHRGNALRNEVKTVLLGFCHLLLTLPIEPLPASHAFSNKYYKNQEIMEGADATSNGASTV